MVIFVPITLNEARKRVHKHFARTMFNPANYNCEEFLCEYISTHLENGEKVQIVEEYEENED